MLEAFRSIATRRLKVLSLADVAMPEPVEQGRNLRENTLIVAAGVASYTKLPTVAVARSFTIDPMFCYSPDPHLTAVREYPTWSWRIPPRERPADLVRAVDRARQTYWRWGFCGPDDQGAYFLTTLCFVAPEADPHFIEEWCEGQFRVRERSISEDPTTPAGFDFAKFFVPTGHTETLASLDSETRADLSDFRKAVHALNAWLSQQE
jgi:inosine/xanthosine triphosphate pyrophosphatase family protein